MVRKLLYILILLMLSVAYADRDVRSDSMQLATGASNLGKGNTYGAQYDDVSGVFTNPASVCGLSSMAFTSFMTTYMDAYNYSAFAMVFPLDEFYLGIGYAGWSVDEIKKTELYDINGLGSYRIYDTGKSFSAGEDNFLLTLAGETRNSLNNWFERIYVGTSIKAQSIYVDNKKTFGYGLTAGTIIPRIFNLNMDLGLTAFNLVAPQPNVGDVSNLEESRLNVGTKFYLSNNWDMQIDFESENQSFGTTYRPFDAVKMKAGINSNSYTAGLGIVFRSITGFDYKPWDLSFDYAFVYEPSKAVLTQDYFGHYFSVSLTAKSATKRPEIKYTEKYLETADNTCQLTGKADASSKVRVYVNEKVMSTVDSDSSGKWSAIVPISNGLNIVYVRSLQYNKDLSLQSKKIYIRKK